MLLTNANTPVRRAGERGLALPMVLFMGIVLFLIVVAGATRGLVGVNQADKQRKYNEALHTADGGADKVLFELVKDKDFETQTPVSAGAVSSAADVPPAFASTDAEKAWAIAQADKKSAAGSTVPANLSSLVPTTGGEWAVMKPPGDGSRVIYAVGYTPSRANVQKTRVLRLEYDFPPFNATNAILTGGNVKIGGSADIIGGAGSIHTNGSFDWTGGGWHVDGSVGASGSFPAGAVPNNIGNKVASGGGKAPQPIPDVDPSDQSTYKLSHYDLCPNGMVRGGPANVLEASPNTVTDPTSGDLIPCAGPILSAAGLYKGWELKTGQWTYQTSACYPGVFYAYLGKVSLKGNPGKDPATCLGEAWKATIIASASHVGAPHCNHSMGDIDIQGTPFIRPYVPKILFIAGRDFSMQGNAAGGGAQVSGAIMVHEQFSVTGSMTLTGNIVANDLCDTSGSPVGQNIINLAGNSSITFNEAAELPFGKLIRITRWSEL
jgi:hypothetical protein